MRRDHVASTLIRRDFVVCLLGGDLHMYRTNICFYHYGSWRRGLGPRKASLSPSVIHYWPFQGGTFIVLLFVACYVVFNFLLFFFSFTSYVSWLYIQFGLNNRVPTLSRKGLPSLLPSVYFVAALLYVSVFIAKTYLFKYTEKFTTKKWKFSGKTFWYFSYFCSKHRLWVLVRTASTRRF